VFKSIVLVLLVVIAGLAAFIATRPAEFTIERTAQVNASPEAVFPLIDNFHNWQSWSPFEKLDPEMKKSFEGPEAGAGASYAWNGNGQAGEGRMTIEQSRPNDGVDMKLEFTRPFASTCKTKFLLVPDSGGTKVTWRMEGSNSFIGKAMSLVMNMDQMIGKEFEEGLSNLNKVTQEPVAQEKAPASN
jgi:Polyketide cyclase / dehydrase and lipid transport